VRGTCATKQSRRSPASSAGDCFAPLAMTRLNQVKSISGTEHYRSQQMLPAAFPHHPRRSRVAPRSNRGLQAPSWLPSDARFREYDGRWRGPSVRFKGQEQGSAGPLDEVSVAAVRGGSNNLQKSGRPRRAPLPSRSIAAPYRDAQPPGECRPDRQCQKMPSGSARGTPAGCQAVTPSARNRK
jgi:hypothetical protein